MPNAANFPGSLPSVSARLFVFLVALAGLALPAGAWAQCDFEYFLSATAPSTVSAGVPFDITATVTDSCGQVAAGYSTYVEFSSSDPSSVFPPGMNLITTGMGTYQATLQTPGTQTITVNGPADVCNGDLPCPVVGITVEPSSFVAASETSVNFGSLAIGSTSEAQTVNFPISPPGNTVGSIAVLTQGAPGMDFTEAAGSTCTATTYTAANCTVNVTFTPKTAGLRMGAVVFFAGASNTGMQLASVPIYGVGTGPQIAYGPGTATAIDPVVNGATLGYPLGVAVDGLGDLFIADSYNYRVVEAPAGGGAAIAISPALDGIALNYSWGLAVDGLGDLFIANNLYPGVFDDFGNGVMEVPVGGGLARGIVPVANGESLSGPNGVAVDGAGNLFVVDFWNGRVVEAPSGGGAAIAIDPTVNDLALNGPYGIAVDGAGDLFITDTSNNRVVEIPASDGTPIAIAPTVNGIALNSPEGIAVDAAGDLFIADTNNNRVVEIPAGGTAIALAPVVNGLGLNAPVGIAVDGTGNLFITDSNNNRVIKIQRSQAPAFNFPTPTPLGSIDVTDGTQTAQVFNIGNEPLDFTAVSYAADFLQPSDDANACASSTSLSAGQECDLPIEFAPENGGTPLSEDVTLTDNALNMPSAQQSIAVSGTVIVAATGFAVSAPSTVDAGKQFTIIVTAQGAGGVRSLDYSGTVSFSSTDGNAVLPAPSKLTAGVATFQVALETLGNQTITAIDAANSLTGTSGTIDVGASLPGLFAEQSSVNFGSQAVGSPGGAQTLNFWISATTVGSIAVLTQGAPNLDFTQAAGTTCATAAYSSATGCVVEVTFTPKAAGLRMGAVVFFSGARNTGTQLASVPVYGIGTGPQIAYGPGSATAIHPTVNSTALSSPLGVAVDGLGNLFIGDSGNNRVVKAPAGGGTATAIAPKVNGEGLNDPDGVAVDGAGDLFIADGGNNRVVEVPAGGGAAIAIDPTVDGEGLSNPFGLALDGAGDLFIGDSGNNRVVEVPACGGAPMVTDPTVNGERLAFPTGVTVDGAGDLFIVDTGNSRVVEIPGGGGAPIAIAPTADGVSAIVPAGIAVDGAGDLFIGDASYDRVVEVPAGGGAAIAIDPTVDGEGLSELWGVAVDGWGDLFIVDEAHNRVVAVQRSQPPKVNFPTPTPVGSIDTADGAETVQIQNIGNEALDLTALSCPADFPEASGDANACTGSTSLSAGQECDVPIEFAPENDGSPLSEEVSLTDNALNVSGARQSIAVSGTSLPQSGRLDIPVPGSVLTGPEVTFAWVPATGATGYSLWIGTTGVGSDNLYDSGERTATSVTVAGLPTNGKTVYARLYTTSGKVTVHSDYMYTAVTQAAITTPAAGATLAVSDVTFSWSAANGASGYSLWLGSTGAGSNNLYDSHETTATSVTVNGLPTNGEAIYAEINTIFSGTSLHSNTTYKAALLSQSQLTNPTPGSVLAGSTVSFTWSATSGATGYSLWLGSTGVGSNNLYDSGETTSLSATAKGLPTNGETIYARMNIIFNGASLHVDTTYTAQ